MPPRRRQRRFPPRPAWPVPLCLLLCWAAAGCPASDRQEKEVEAFLQAKVELLEDHVWLLHSVKDKDGMEAAWPRLVEQDRQEKELQERALQMPRPAPDTLARLGVYFERLQAAKDGQTRERERIGKLEGGAAFLQKLDGLRDAPAATPPRDGEAP